MFDVDILPVAPAELRRSDNTIGDSKNRGAVTGNKIETAVVARAITAGRNPVTKTRMDGDRGGKGPPDGANTRGGVGEISVSIPSLEDIGEGRDTPGFALNSHLA
jgi:hypothetical protein